METNPLLIPVNLVKCLVRDGAGGQRPRYIEVENYRLWEYLVTTKHGLQVEEKARCLWVSSQAYQSARDTYEKSGAIEPVNRIIIFLNHPQFGYDTILQRFAGKSESQPLFNVLKTHLSHELIEGKATGSEVVPGYAIEHLDAEGRFRRLAHVPSQSGADRATRP